MTLFYFDYNCLQQVRRGADKAGIYSIALSPNIQWLAVSSDKGTVHIFSLRVRVVGEDRSTDSAVVRGPALCHQNSSNSLDALISSSTSSNPGSSLSFMKGRTYIWLYDLFFCKVLLHWVARRLLVAAWFEMTNGREIHSLIFMLMGPFYLDLFFYARLKGFSFFLWCLVKWFCIKIEKKNLASSFCLSSPHFHCVLCDFPIDLTWYHKTMLNCLINKLNLLEWVQFYLVFNTSCTLDSFFFFVEDLMCTIFINGWWWDLNGWPLPTPTTCGTTSSPSNSSLIMQLTTTQAHHHSSLSSKTNGFSNF